MHVFEFLALHSTTYVDVVTDEYIVMCNLTLYFKPNECDTPVGCLQKLVDHQVSASSRTE